MTPMQISVDGVLGPADQLRISPRARRRLRRIVERFDPNERSPEEHLPALE